MAKSKEKKVPRNGSALAAKMRKGGPMKHRLEPKKGAVNKQAEILNEAEEQHPLIVRTSGVVGGRARIAGTRIAVWLIQSCHLGGWTDEEILEEYPSINKQKLEAAWNYIDANREEIASDLEDNRNDVPPVHICFDCDQPAKWVRNTQFAGDHYFCDPHAKKESDFGKKVSGFDLWSKL